MISFRIWLSSPAVSAKPSVPRSCRSVVIATCQPRADLADDVLDGHLHVGEEDLVELGLAGDLAERAHLDARRVHVDEQVAEAGVALAVGVAAGDEDAPVGDVGERRPDLLPVDDEVVSLEQSRAVVRTAERSEPASGSEKPWHQISSVERIFSRCFCFWASVPCAMIVGPAMPSPITPRWDGASARAISSRKIAWWLYGAEAPPYSFGQVRPA